MSLFTVVRKCIETTKNVVGHDMIEGRLTVVSAHGRSDWIFLPLFLAIEELRFGL